MEYLNIQIFDITAKILSCIVSSVVIFCFFDARYERSYSEKFLYLLVKCVVILLSFVVNLFQLPIVNLSYWVLIILFASRFLYYGEQTGILKYYLLNVSFLFAYSLCEAAGGILVELGIRVLGIQQEASVISFVCSLSSSISVIFLYYLLLRRLIVKEKQQKVSVIQYVIYVLISAYVLINIGGILFLMQHTLTERDYLFLLLDAVLIIVINLILFYILDVIAKNNELKYKLSIYESQAKSNYEYYESLLQNNKKMMAAIHDIRKHVRVMEELQQPDKEAVLEEYMTSFEKMLDTLNPAALEECTDK